MARWDSLKLPAPEIGADDVTQRVLAVIWEERSLDADGLASAKAVAAVENRPLKEDDGLPQAVRPHVGDEAVELLALEQWKKVGERVES